ncbi:MAG TPA: hypothetical protein VGM56_16865, partial [Byssovorax sp.]
MPTLEKAVLAEIPQVARVLRTALPLLGVLAFVGVAHAQNGQPGFPTAAPGGPGAATPAPAPGGPGAPAPGGPGAPAAGPGGPGAPAAGPAGPGAAPGGDAAPPGGFTFGAEPGAAPPPDEEAAAHDSGPAPDEREMSLMEQPNMYGSTGLLRTSYAGSGAVGTFRVALLFDWFSTGSWLCDPGNLTKAGAEVTCNSSNKKDSASHVGGTFTLNATPFSFLEAYLNLRTYANSDDQGSPQLLQVLGDTTIGVKAFRPPKLGQLLTFGGEAQLLLLNGAGDVGLAGGGTSALFRGLATADFRKPEGHGFPLRINLNLAYKLDNSGTLVEDVEKARAADFTDGRTTSPITRIERYGLGINRVDFFQTWLGVELPFNKIQPFLEWTLDIPVNRQGYTCHTGHVAQGDVCLGAEDLNNPHSGGTGFSAIPSRLSLGLKTNPFEHAFKGLSATAAFEIGTSGTSTFVEEIAPTPPWTLYIGFGYAFDTKDKSPPPAPPAPPVVMPAPQTYVRGFVHEANKPDAAVADAFVTIEGKNEPPFATG